METKKIEVPVKATGIENADQITSTIDERALLPGKIDIEAEKRSVESLIDSEAEIDRIQAPRMPQYRGSNVTIGRPKDFLKKRKKRQRMRNKTKNANRRKK